MALVITSKRNGREVGYFNSYILRRIKRNKNFICCITGQTGSGKSYSVLKEAEILDPDFNIDNVCFTPQQFMDLVNEKTKKLHRGSVIMYDEVQVTMSALDFQSLQAKMINYVLQTFRYRGFILFMTSPFFSFINASARKLFHSRMETISIDHSNKICTLKPFLLQTSQDTGKTYRKYLRVSTSETGLVPLKTIKVSLASKTLIEQYEAKRREFTQQLNENISRDLEKLDKKNYRKDFTTQQNKVALMLLKGMLIPAIATELNTSLQTIYEHINGLKKKGVDVKPIRDKNVILKYEITGYKGN